MLGTPVLCNLLSKDSQCPALEVQGVSEGCKDGHCIIQEAWGMPQTQCEQYVARVEADEAAERGSWKTTEGYWGY